MAKTTETRERGGGGINAFDYHTQAGRWAAANAQGPCSLLVSADATKWLPSRLLIMRYGGWSHVPLAHAGMIIVEVA